MTHSKLNNLSTKINSNAKGLFSLSLESKLLNESKLFEDFLFVLSKENCGSKSCINNNETSGEHGHELAVCMDEGNNCNSDTCHV